MKKQKVEISLVKKDKQFARIPTKNDREFLHLLFRNYVLRTRENLLKRLDELGWNHKTLERLEELGFITKPTWNAAVEYYERKLFLRVLRSD